MLTYLAEWNDADVVGCCCLFVSLYFTLAPPIPFHCCILHSRLLYLCVCVCVYIFVISYRMKCMNSRVLWNKKRGARDKLLCFKFSVFFSLSLSVSVRQWFCCLFSGVFDESWRRVVGYFCLFVFLCIFSGCFVWCTWRHWWVRVKSTKIHRRLSFSSMLGFNFQRFVEGWIKFKINKWESNDRTSHDSAHMKKEPTHRMYIEWRIRTHFFVCLPTSRTLQSTLFHFHRIDFGGEISIMKKKPTSSLEIGEMKKNGQQQYTR